MKSSFALCALAGFFSFVSALPTSGSDRVARWLPIFPNSEEGSLERRQTPSKSDHVARWLPIFPNTEEGDLERRQAPSRSDHVARWLPIFPNSEEGGLERRQAPSSSRSNPIDFFGFSYAITVNEALPNDLFYPQQSGAVGRVNGTSETITYFHFDLPAADQINGVVTEATECVAAIVPNSVLSNLDSSEIPTVLMFNLAAGRQLNRSALSFNARPSTDRLLTAITYGGDAGTDFVSLNQFAKQKCNFGGGMDFAARSIGENSMISFSANSANDTAAGAVIFVINP
jgi:hypothetical protein